MQNEHAVWIMVGTSGQENGKSSSNSVLTFVQIPLSTYESICSPPIKYGLNSTDKLGYLAVAGKKASRRRILNLKPYGPWWSAYNVALEFKMDSRLQCKYAGFMTRGLSTKLKDG